MQKFYLTILFLMPAVLFAGNTAINSDCMPVASITESRNNICVDSSITFKAKISNAGTNSTYKWKRNGSDVGTNTATYTAADFRDGDLVSCEYGCISVCGTTVTVSSNSITVRVINQIDPSIIVGNADTLICEGELTFFTTKAVYGNAIPSYQWKINDWPIQDTTPLYTTDTLTNGSKVECVLTTTVPGCPGSKSANNFMTIYVYPLIHPAITITPSKTDICRGETVTFRAIANGGAYPSFAWELNGKPTGDTSAALVTSNLDDGDSISCTITIDQDSRCHTTTSAPSNKIGMHVKDYIDPAITIDAPLLEACIGTPLSFAAITKNTGDYVLYEWQVNDHFMGENSQTFVTDKLKNGDKISCILSTNIPGCDFTKDVPSNDEVVTMRDAPVITFTPPDISILSGEAAQLNATVTGNIASFAWTPADLLITPQSLITYTQPLGDDVVFNLSVTDVNGCKASNDLAVKVLYKMHVPSAFTPNNDGLNDVFRIPPGSSVILQQFAVYDRWGHIIFETTDISKGWDGTYRGIALPNGTYVYLIKGTFDDRSLVEKGTVTLIR